MPCEPFFGIFEVGGVRATLSYASEHLSIRATFAAENDCGADYHNPGHPPKDYATDLAGRRETRHDEGSMGDIQLQATVLYPYISHRPF